MTHGNLLANAGAIARAVDLDDRDVLLGVTLSGGPDFARDLCVRRSTPEERAGLDLRRWRVAFNGAEPVQAQTLDRYARAFAPAGFHPEALCPCYGLAEATLLVTVSPPGEPPNRTGDLGRLPAAARRDGGGTRLLAAVVPRPEAAPDGLADDLRRFLRERLPAPMIPADLMVRGELPLTPSGKVDRKALARLRIERTASTPPGTEIERELAALWTEVLGAPQVGLEDGFFELGGHSLLAGQLLARVRKAFGIDLPLAALLEDPTLGGMAAAVTAALAAQEPGLDTLLELLDGMHEEEAERLLAGGTEITT